MKRIAILDSDKNSEIFERDNKLFYSHGLITPIKNGVFKHIYEYDTKAKIEEGDLVVIDNKSNILKCIKVYDETIKCDDCLTYKKKYCNKVITTTDNRYNKIYKKFSKKEIIKIVNYQNNIEEYFNVDKQSNISVSHNILFKYV